MWAAVGAAILAQDIVQQTWLVLELRVMLTEPVPSESPPPTSCGPVMFGALGLLLPLQRPASQVSPCVQALLSLQDVPSATAGFEQAPVTESHVPAAWHWSEAAHTTGLLPVQTPAWQLSDFVHALPSLQALPFAAVGFEHVPVTESHVPAAWH